MPVDLLTIDRTELKRKLDNHDYFFLVETLPAENYNHTHLPGALNLPPDRIKELASTVLPEKNADIVVYCAKPT